MGVVNIKSPAVYEQHVNGARLGPWGGGGWCKDEPAEAGLPGVGRRLLPVLVYEQGQGRPADQPALQR